MLFIIESSNNVKVNDIVYVLDGEFSFAIRVEKVQISDGKVTIQYTDEEIDGSEVISDIDVMAW